MNFHEIENYCNSLIGTTSDFPFDEETMVFRVGGKIYALINTLNAQSINLKCDPERAIDLRDRYEAIIPGWHMNKKHWNTVSLTVGGLKDAFIKELILHSYKIVLGSLSKKTQAEILL